VPVMCKLIPEKKYAPTSLHSAFKCKD